MTTYESRARGTGLGRRSLLKAAGGLTLGALGSGAAGCTANGSGPSGGSSDVNQGTKVELPAPVSEVLYPDPYVGPKAYGRKPFADGTKTFTVVVPQDPTWVGDWNKNQFSSWLEKRTGVKVKYEAVNLTSPDGSQNLSKINAMLSSGDLPDAFMSVGLSGAQISLYGQQGLFVDLTGLIDTYAPVERQMLTEVDDLKQTMTALDGKIYQFAGINQCYHCRTGLNKTFINQSYLDKVGASMPESTEDFRSVLKEFAERNPSGKEGFLPFVGGNTGFGAVDVWFVNPFTYNPGQPWIRLNGGKVEFVPNTDGWRQGMAYMRQLYDDRSLTKQSLTITGPETVKLGDQGLIGSARNLFWGSFLSIQYSKDALWHQYAPVMPLKGPSGGRIATNDYYTSPSNVMVITKACKNPELLAQWADYQMDAEAILRAFPKGGQKGKQWDWATKGNKGIDGRQAVWKAFNNTQQATVGIGWNQSSLMYRSLDERNGQWVDPKAPNFEADLYQLSKRYTEFSQPKDQQLPPLIFDETATATISDLETTIQNHVTQSMAKFATAELDVNDDTVWNNYVNTLQKMNLNQYLELYQQAYDKRPK